MKLKPLLEALRLARHSLLNNDFIPILSHFCFLDDTLYAYNDVSAVIVQHKTGLECALRGDVLLGVLEAGTGEDANIKPGKDAADITAGGSKIKMPLLQTEDFLFTLPEEEPNVTLPFDEDVINAFKVCLLSVGQDALRPEFTGVTARISKTGVVFYSSDNDTISRYVSKPLKKAPRKEEIAILPKSTCQQALDIYAEVVKDADKQKPQLMIGDKFAVFSFNSDPDVTIVSKLLEAESVDFEKIVQAQLKGCKLFNIPDEFPHAIKRAGILLQKDLDKHCGIATNGKALRVDVDGQLGKLEAEMKATVGYTRAVTVNPSYVERVLAHCKTIGISSEGGLLLQGESYTSVISSAKAPE